MVPLLLVWSVGLSLVQFISFCPYLSLNQSPPGIWLLIRLCTLVTLFVLYCTIFTSFVRYLYHSSPLESFLLITALYFICTTVFTLFVLYLYHNPPQESYLPFRWPLSPFLIRLVLLGSLTHCYPPFYLYFARGLLEVQRRHNVYRLL